MMDTMQNNQALNIICTTGEALQAALMHRDEYTQNHCERVTYIAVQTGKFLKFNAEQLAQLEAAAIFHDIGKIGIPDDILLNPGKLTGEQYKHMQTHVVVGTSIAQKLDIPNADKVAEIILHHHEHYDGTGYPHGLKGDEIPLSSRIITVVDVFDALSSPRRYREPMSAESTLDKMEKEMMHEFDPKVFEVVSQVVRSNLTLLANNKIT